MSDHLDPRVRLTSQLETEGGDPSFLLELVEGMIARKDWLTLPTSRTDPTPVGSFRKLIESPVPTGCGLPADKLMRFLDFPHRYEAKMEGWQERMKALRLNVRQLLNEEVPAKAKHGTNQHTSGRNPVTSVADVRGNSPNYLLGVLKRDRPDLAERVTAGELKAKTAARMAGIKRPVTEVYLDDMGDAARKLVNKLDADQIDELITELQKRRG